MANDAGYSSPIPTKAGFQVEAKATNYARLLGSEWKPIRALTSAV
jgi:hypothetical protein